MILFDLVERTRKMLFVHTTLFLYFFPLHERRQLSFFCSLPLVRVAPLGVNLFLFHIARLIFLFVLSKFLLSIGILFMEDLYRAVEQFLPHSSGGGGSSIPPQLPDPAGNVGVVAADIANNNPFGERGISESSLQSLNSDKQDELRRLLHGEEVTSQPIIEPLLSDAERRMELEEELQRMIDNEIKIGGIHMDKL